MEDELTQAVTVNENLNKENEVEAIMRFNCPSCITKNIMREGGGIFGDDSDDDDGKKKRVILDDFKEQTDPVSDPLSDSLPDKNKLSKSERSL